MIDFENVCSYVENVSLKQLTTIKIGGIASFVCYPKTVSELIKTKELCAKHKILPIILGNGSNVLILDNFSGVVLSTKKLNSISFFSTSKVRVGAGVSLSVLCAECEKKGYYCLSPLSGIPGTVGGAVVMNAGAFCTEIAQFVDSVVVLNNGKVITLPKSQLFFDYRKSAFTNNQNCVILEVVFQLSKSTPSLNIIHYAHLRHKTQNVGYPSMGSVFKRQGELIPAKLIESCGLKGTKIGGAMVSCVHSGFIVNTGGATSSDVMKLIELIRKRVKQKFGVWLELEIVILGGKN